MKLPTPLRLALIGLFGAHTAAFVAPAAAADGAVENVKVAAVAYFDFNGTGIRPADRDAILAEVGAMKNVTWQSITTVGYTDSIGSSRYNEKLSARRANAVKTYLVSKGIDRSMIDAVGKGAAAPIADNESADGRAKNRRTVIEFKGIRTASK